MYIPTPKGGDFEKPEPGTHLALCYQIIDMGTMWNEGFALQQRKVDIYWELPNSKTKKGEPMIIKQRYTMSGHKKSNFRKHLEAWRGRAFDEEKDFGPNGRFKLENVIGKACLLAIVHSENGDYANVTAVMAMQRGQNQTIPNLHNKTRFFSLNAGELSQEVYDGLSDGLREQIAKSPEYQELMHQKKQSKQDVSYEGDGAGADGGDWRDGNPPPDDWERSGDELPFF